MDHLKGWQNMYLEDELHLSYKIGNAPLNFFPFPHFYVENIFGNSFYSAIQENFPSDSFLFPISKKRALPEGSYKERFVLSLDDSDLEKLPNAEFWVSLKRQLLGVSLKNFLLSRFQEVLKKYHPNLNTYETFSEILIVKDKENYSLGPHTDNPRKLLTILFYLPTDNSEENNGTSIYLPKDYSFRCKGGPHYNREDFNLVYTAPFKQNSAFGFIKTDNSFHGVEKVSITNSRWLLLYDIYYRENQKKPITS